MSKVNLSGEDLLHEEPFKNKHSDGWSEGGEARSEVLVRDQQNLIGLIDKIHVEHDGDGVRGIWWSSLHIPRLHVSVWKPG